MRNGIIGVVVAAAAVGIVLLALKPTAGQVPTSDFPRTTDGKPNFNGIWQAVNTANWDIQDHSAAKGPVAALGAAFSVPAGTSVVVGNEIPYQPAALAKRNENAANWWKLDPEVKCFMPGVPRAIYMPYPFQIVQTPTHILMAHEFASAARTVYLTPMDEAPVDSWMGWSRGKWEGDTLVVDVSGFNGKAWFDRAGNYQTGTLHVVEKFTPLNRNALTYEATIEDPALYTRPWTITMPIYRRLEKDAQLLEYKCVEFSEEMLYGHLRKPAAK